MWLLTVTEPLRLKMCAIYMLTVCTWLGWNLLTPYKEDDGKRITKKSSRNSTAHTHTQQQKNSKHF